MATNQTCLDIGDLIDVLDLLKRCSFQRTKWQELGLRLGLLKDTLEAIEAKHRGDVTQCLTECLSHWLRRADNVDSRGGANLDSLSDALRSMNETAVAEKLKPQVLINIFNNCHIVLSQSLCNPVAIAWLLYGERMLTQEAVSRVVSASPSIPNQREALLTAVKEAVQTDPNSLHTFANVLCTISTNVSLGQTILDDISKYFPIPEVGVVPETIKDYDVAPQDNTSTEEIKMPTNTEPGSTADTEVTSTLSSQPLSSESSQVKIPVPKRFSVRFSSISGSYSTMFYNVCNILEKKLEFESIKKYLSYYTSLRHKVDKCSDLSSILYLIQDECSLTDIELLCSVVKEMKITEADEHIETYRTKLNEFYRSISVSLCLDKKLNSVSYLQCETVTFIFDWEPEEHVLQDIKDILSEVSGKLLIIKFIGSSTSICVTCSFPFSDVGFTVLRMIENIHILMRQGLKKLTIGNLTLWRRQDVRQKELRERDQDLLQHAEVISYIILEEAEYKLRDTISSKEKETVELKQEISLMVQATEEEPLYEELTVLRSQFNEIKKENKKLSDKLSKMKIEDSKSLTINTDSDASKLRRGISLEIDDCKFHLKAMTRPDYQPLVDNKRIIEKLQERITLMNMGLITEREHNEKIIKDIKDHLKEIENRQREKKQKIKKEMFGILLYCNHPVTGELRNSFLTINKNELLPSVLDEAYELMELAPHIPIERCRLVKYDYLHTKVMHQSFDLDEYQYHTIGQIMSVAGYYGLFLETCKENETFKKYNDGGINLEILVVDLSTGEVAPAVPMRGEEDWTVGELKQHIGELLNTNLSCMRIVMEEKYYQGDVASFHDISDVGGTLGKILYEGKRASRFKQLLYVTSDSKDYQKGYEDSFMYKIINIHPWILLNITIPPPGPKATPTTTNFIERSGIIMKIVSINEENKEKERKIQVQVSKSITLDQLKEILVPLIGVPTTGFRVCGIRNNKEYEMEGLYQTLMDFFYSGSELIVRLGRAVLQEGEERIKLYLLQVNNTEFCSFMMDSIVTEDTRVREFKRQIIEEAKVQGIDCVLELDKMRLRDKSGVSPSTVYHDHQLIDTSGEIYVESLKGPEKKHEAQIQVYVIRWRPSQCSVDPIEEIILNSNDPKHVIRKLSELSRVSAEYISYTKGESFPVDISCLDIENKFEWYSITSDRYVAWKPKGLPFFTDYMYYSSGRYYDGHVIYYKDDRETMKELTDKERSEIHKAEEARLERIRECESKHKHRY